MATASTAARALLRASILLLVASCQFADAVPVHSYSAAERPLQNRAGRFYYDDEPFTGRIYEAEGKDTLSNVGYRDGREHGEWRKYYRDGKLRETRFFLLGVKTGTMRSYWDNGQLQLEYHFKDNEYEGRCREWNREGQLIAERNYHNGYEEGGQTLWYDNGTVRSNYVITGGRRYGLLGTKNCVNVSDSVFRNLLGVDGLQHIPIGPIPRRPHP
ncbi:MAG: toxin-antitoxin system YwqK family antitoxin [Chitinophagaceae bacterium]|nr:MAG: toxin-antitoxin system YwqK family antitoxin [Chitinophagaceae bacterium]